MAQMRQFSIELLLFLMLSVLVSSFVVRQAELPVETKCSGGFDIYFVLDTSTSISVTHFQNQTVNFVEELYKRFTSSNLRVSFILFSSVARTTMSLTGNSDFIVSRILLRESLRDHIDLSTLHPYWNLFTGFHAVLEEIQEGIEELRTIEPIGTTRLSEGLIHANQQIKLEGGDSASVVIALTDGKISDKEDSEIQANTTREFGGSILTVRVGLSAIDDLLGVADPPAVDHIFRGDTFDDLETVIAKIIDTSCVEILRVTPDEVCADEAFNVSIYGNGFDKTLDISTVFCNFKLNDTDFKVKPTNVTSTYLICESPRIPKDGLVEVQVSVNGKSFVSSNVTVVATDCTPPNVLPLILGLLGAALLIGLFLLWFFWNLLCCAVVVKKEEAPKPRPPSVVQYVAPPPPPAREAPRLVPGPSKVKHWPKVDVSLIGGVGAGGIRPVAVRWGSTGNTEAAMHLEKGKQASVVGAIKVETQGPMVPERPPPPRGDTPPPPPPPRAESTSSRGCCACIPETFSKIFAPIKSFYDRVALMRPQPGEKGRCCTFRRE